MRRQIDLDKAAEGEAFGALAIGHRDKQAGSGFVGRHFTPAQRRAVSDLAQSLVQIARKAGAERKRITVGRVSFEIRENGAEEILSIRLVATS